MNTRPEPQGRSPESVPADGSPHVHAMADAAQQELSQAEVVPRETATQTDAQTRAEEEDGSQERGEAAGAPTRPSAVTIMFRARDEHGEWNRLVHQMVVDPSDPSPVERMAAKNARVRQATFYDQNLRQVPPAQCFDAAIEDGTNTVFVTFGDDLVVSEETMESVTRALQADGDHDRAARRRQ